MVVFRLQKRLLRIRQFHRGTQHVKPRLAARREELLDVRQMRLIFLNRLLADFNLLLCFQYIVIGLDYRQTQVLPRPLRLQPCRVHADFRALDVRLILAARIKRQIRTKRNRAVVLPCLVVRPAVRQGAVEPNVKAVRAARTFQVRPRRFLTFFRDTERRILCQREVHCFLYRKGRRLSNRTAVKQDNSSRQCSKIPSYFHRVSLPCLLI